ncbi:unnamed protein product [Rhizophagus irregularis]|nr:unnamed protein product [Rhizophagus irregularis]
MDTPLPEELIPEELTEVIVSTVNISVMDQCDQKSLKDKETDAFLDEEYKKKVSDEIRQRNRVKKLQDLDLPGTSDIPSLESSTSSHPIPNNPVLSEQNAKIKAPEIDIQPLIQKLLIEPLEEDCVKIVNVEESDQSPAIKLAHLYEKTKFAEIRTIRAKQDEIMSWYCYRKYFEKRHSEILPGILKNGVITNKKAYELASGQIYDEMLQSGAGHALEVPIKSFFRYRVCEKYVRSSGKSISPTVSSSRLLRILYPRFLRLTREGLSDSGILLFSLPP